MRDHREVVDVADLLRRNAGSATFAQLRASVSGRAIRNALAFSWEDVMFDAEWVVATVRRAVGDPALAARAA